MAFVVMFLGMDELEQMLGIEDDEPAPPFVPVGTDPVPGDPNPTCGAVAQAFRFDGSTATTDTFSLVALGDGVRSISIGDPSFFQFQQAFTVVLACFRTSPLLTRAAISEVSLAYRLFGQEVLEQSPYPGEPHLQMGSVVSSSSIKGAPDVPEDELLTGYSFVANGAFSPAAENPIPTFEFWGPEGYFQGWVVPGIPDEVRVNSGDAGELRVDAMSNQQVGVPPIQDLVNLDDRARETAAANLPAVGRQLLDARPPEQTGDIEGGADPEPDDTTQTEVTPAPATQTEVTPAPATQTEATPAPATQTEAIPAETSQAEATPPAPTDSGSESDEGGSLQVIILALLIGGLGFAVVVAARKKLFGQSDGPVEPPVEETEPLVPFDGGSGIPAKPRPPVEETEPLVPLDGQEPDIESPIDQLLASPAVQAAAATQEAIDAAGAPTVDWGDGAPSDGSTEDLNTVPGERTETGLPYVAPGYDLDEESDPLAGEPIGPPPVRPRIWVVGERGLAIAEVVRHDPFGIVAVHPDDGSAPATLEVLLQVGSQSRAVTLAQVGSESAGYVTYRSNGHVLDSDWELGEFDVANGARMTITADGFFPFTGHAHSEHASRDLALGMQYLRQAEDAWRGVLAALPVLEERAGDRLDIAGMRAIATGFLRMIELAVPAVERYAGQRWVSVLDDDRIEWGKAAAVAEAAVRRIPADPMTAFQEGTTPQINATGEGRFVQVLETAATDQYTQTRNGFLTVIGGSVISGYRVFATTSGGDIWWTLATATDETGAARTRSEALQDLLVEALVGHLVGLGTRGLMGGPDLPLNATDTKRKVPPLWQTGPKQRTANSGPPSQGVIVDGEVHGLRNDLLADAQRVASDLGIVMALRPGNVNSMRWQQLGHPVKNTEIKSKTLGPRDAFIGGPTTSAHGSGPSEPFGLVGYFDPHLSSRPDWVSDVDWDVLLNGGRRLPGMTEEAWVGVKQTFTEDVHRILGGRYAPAGAPADIIAELPGRFAQRRLEFEDNAAWYGQLIDEGKIEIRNGVVWNTGLYEGKHVGITGDIDVFDIHGLDGAPLPYERYLEVVDYLKAHPDLLIVHGAHMRWPWDSPLKNSKDKGIFVTIIANHAGKEPVILVGGFGDGLVRATYTQNGNLITATGGRVLWSPDGGWISPHSYQAPIHIGHAVQGAAIPSAAGVDGDPAMWEASEQASVGATTQSIVPAQNPAAEGPRDDTAGNGVNGPSSWSTWQDHDAYREACRAHAADLAIQSGNVPTRDGWTWVTHGQWYAAFPTPIGPALPEGPDAFSRFINVHTLETIKYEDVSTDPLDRSDAEAERCRVWNRLTSELSEGLPTPQQRIDWIYDNIELNDAMLADVSDDVIDL